MRCIDYLFTRDDFNKKELAVTGGSQGGALTLITSGLDPRATLAAPNVAAMCDHSGMALDRVSGWRCSARRATPIPTARQAARRSKRHYESPAFNILAYGLRGLVPTFLGGS